MQPEKRSITAQHDAGTIRLTIPYNSLSEDLGGFRERILPGAFTRSLSSGEDILALWSHDPTKPLAKRSNGTLTLATDAVGLTAIIQADQTSWSEDARRSIESGTTGGASFAFRTVKDRFYRESGEWKRDLIDAELLEVSPTASPAYPQSTAVTTVY
jgi:uncharacterized protein